MTVGIIGAGPSGLAAAKAALEEGLQPHVIEKGKSVGGLWKPDKGVMWDGLQTNISRYSCMFSDFSWEKGAQLFPNQSEVYRYLTAYVDAFHLSPYIHLECEAQKVELEGKKWKVEWLEKGKIKYQVFDHLVIASGIFSKPFIPEIAGKDKFQGFILHSSDYKKPHSFAGKKIAVIGNGFSGCEIAAEVSEITQPVFSIAKEPIWVLQRQLPLGEKKLPLDFIFYNRASNAATKKCAPNDKNRITHQWFKEITKQEEAHRSLTVKTAVTNPVFVAISETYTQKVQGNSIIYIEGEIKEILERGIRLKNGTFLDADAIIFATGYETSLPFFKQEILDLLSFDPKDRFQPLLLHKATWSQLPNLAFVGMYRGPNFATMELQARWSMSVFSGKTKYPDQETLEKGISVEKGLRDLNPHPQFPHGDYVNFADDLAKELDLLPDFERLLRENPALHHKLWEGPLIPPHYRLYGRNQNTELALKIIDEVNN